MSDKVRPTHLDRRAVVYLRQSDPKQVREHRESTARQYALHERAVALGWPAERVQVIDEDLGQSGTSAQWRRGFQGLADDVAHGRVGAIFGLEVARLARSSADCHRLLELCGLADVLIIDEQSVFTPRDFNDRLLLGLKGTMSEAELYWMRLRLDGAKLHKARRGELYFVPASGYVWDPGTARFRFDPDEQVQRALHLVFERFRLDGSAYGVARYFARHGLTLPARDVPTRQLRWGPPRQTLIRSILHNPIYAGAYVYGRSEERLGLVNGPLRRRCKRKFPQEAWPICLRDHHPAYMSWDEFMANQRRLADNRPRPPEPDRRGAAREGRARAQPARLVKIGALTESWGPTPAIVGLRVGLQELGYREDEHFSIGVRFTEGKHGDLPAAARDLVRHQVDIIVTTEAGAAAKAAQAATTRIPIVFIGGSDPIGLGLVTSFARPGGNITGIADLDLDLAPKRIEIFREMVPGLKRILLPYDTTNPYAVAQLAVHRDVVRRLGLTLVERPVRSEKAARAAITGLRKGEADGILSPRFLSLNIPGFILEIAPRGVIPTMFHGKFPHEPREIRHRNCVPEYLAAREHEVGPPP